MNALVRRVLLCFLAILCVVEATSWVSNNEPWSLRLEKSGGSNSFETDDQDLEIDNHDQDIMKQSSIHVVKPQMQFDTVNMEHSKEMPAEEDLRDLANVF
jgi:hypothetical protein